MVVTIDQNVLRYMKKYLPISIDFLTNPPKSFTYHIGFISLDKYNEVSAEIPDILINTGNPAILSGIKILNKRPWAKFVWQTTDNPETYSEPSYEDLTQVYDVIYPQLANYFPCELVKVDKKQYVLIFDDHANYVVIDMSNSTAFYDEKYNWKDRHKHSLGNNGRLMCKQLTKTAKFAIDEEISLTVEQYVFTKILREAVKLYKIYRGTLTEEEKKTQ